MKWYSTFKHEQGWRFIIWQDELSGFYLYVYETQNAFDEDTPKGVDPRHHQWDYHQDDLSMAQRHALKKFGVPLNSWRPVEDA